MEKNNILKDIKEYMEAKDAEVAQLRARIRDLELQRNEMARRFSAEKRLVETLQGELLKKSEMEKFFDRLSHAVENNVKPR